VADLAAVVALPAADRTGRAHGAIEGADRVGLQAACPAKQPHDARHADDILSLYGEATYNEAIQEKHVMATAETTRTARVEARIAPDALAVVRRAAELQGRSVSDFLVAAALKDAQRTIEDAQIIRLSVEDQQRFADLLLNPPPLAPAMKRALKARQRLVANAK